MTLQGCLMALILQEYLLQLDKQSSRQAVKYHDSVVEVNIVRKNHMKVVINKSFSHFQGVFFQERAETTEL